MRENSRNLSLRTNNMTATNTKYLLLGAMAGCLAADAAAADSAAQKKVRKDSRPNIIIIMADDMGYSDIGCFGSEIPTPNIDALAQDGLRYTQFYNTGRSCPSRASLLTGLYAQQAGIGRMSEDPGSQPDKNPKTPPAYQGYLNDRCVTIAEVLKSAGYDTYMTGKWHVGMHGEEKWPLQRGFDRFYGILAGACNYLQPKGGRGLTLDNTRLDPPAQPYYTTDAFTDYALDFISNREKDRPFFLYLAFNAPHWPLQAKQEDIDKFLHKYDGGWQQIRQARLKKQKELGIVPQDCGTAEWESRTWDQLTDEEKANSSLRMSVYAAQVHCLDRNVGRVIDYLEKSGQRENTLVIFLSDNGGCAEPYSETGFGTTDEINDLDSWVHPSYGLPWAQVSNTPFRKYKVRAYEGGISTPLILSWPAKTDKYEGQLRTMTGHIIDLMATCVDVSGAVYPEKSADGSEIHPLEGRSLVPTIKDAGAEIHDCIYGEHFENKFIRRGNWKAVCDEKGKKWELYDISADRTESHDLSAEHPEILEDLTARWQKWADTHDVYPKNL